MACYKLISAIQTIYWRPASAQQLGLWLEANPLQSQVVTICVLKYAVELEKTLVRRDSPRSEYNRESRSCGPELSQEFDNLFVTGVNQKTMIPLVDEVRFGQ